MRLILSLLITFAEPNFPLVDVAALPQIEGAVETRSVTELRAALDPNGVLVWRHGSAFPAEAWEAVFKFLEAGGSLLYLGGEPFTRPVTGEPGQRAVGPRTLAMLKALRLNQCYRVGVGGATLRGCGALSKEIDARKLLDEAWAAVLEPRLSDARDFPDEDGAPGYRDATLTPLAHLFSPHDVDYPVAAAAIAINRLRGPFAGGRWVFWLCSEFPPPAVVGLLAREASRAPAELRAEPTLACFRPDEDPSILLRAVRPRATGVESVQLSVKMLAPDPSERRLPTRLPDQPFEVGRHGSARLALPPAGRPGLWRVTVGGDGFDPARTGFWVFDPKLFESGEPWRLSGGSLQRGGLPFPVVGTTVMAADVQRKFLLAPNPALWEGTFQEIAYSGFVRGLRTGVWSGWRAITPEPGLVSEQWMRALEAYYLSARSYDMPVLFTFFAFLPEAYGGKNPYLDPRAVEGQRAFVSAVARRFAPCKEIMWDLINEPSFCSDKHLWKCRPNGDEFEKRAFIEWLKKRYTPAEAGGDPNAWETVVRARWRLTPDEPIGVPAEADFDDAATVFEQRRPFRAVDYVHFAQDAFAGWVREMTAAIREAGSQAPITVGQDEGGLLQRPGPLFHHDAVDFTSMHTWWNNADLLWDGLCSKAAGKPLLISETGVMQRELLSGEALRDPNESARLLSRKIGYAFASGAFGVVQWCYDVNPYMASDNEVAIGLKRVDGSFKPEFRVLRDFADFVSRKPQRFDQPAEPEVVVVIPSGDLFSPRDAAAPATRRAVDVLARELGVIPRLVPDYRLDQDLGSPKAIILPANRGISERGWQALRAAARGGGLLICDGWFETDDAGIDARRLGLSRRPLALFEPVDATAAVAPGQDSPPSGSAPNPGEHGPLARALLDSHGRDAHAPLQTLPAPASAPAASPGSAVRFPLNVVESWFAAEGPPAATLRQLDGATVWHHPLPLEWATDSRPLREFYAAGLAQAGVGVADVVQPPGVFVGRVRFSSAQLVIAINESSQAARVPFAPGAEIDVPAGECRMVFLDAAGATVLDRSHAPH